eukprot:902351_1
MDTTSKTIKLALISDANETDTDYSSSSFTTYPAISGSTPDTPEKNVEKEHIPPTNIPEMKLVDATTNYSMSDSDANTEPLTNANNFSYPLSDSDDSFAELSETEVYRKLIRKLTTKPNENNEHNEKRSKKSQN